MKQWWAYPAALALTIWDLIRDPDAFFFGPEEAPIGQRNLAGETFVSADKGNG